MPFTTPSSTPPCSGSGKVFKGDLLLSDVLYAVALETKYQDVSGLTATGVIPTGVRYLISISAQSPTIQALPHDKLTLQMEDGQRLDFFWCNGGATATNGIY